MNIIQIQDRLKDFSEQQLINEMQRPTGSAPQYLVLSELERRKKVKQSYEAKQGSEPTVAEEAVMSRMMPAQMTARAGMGLPNIARQPMRMSEGGGPLGIRQNNPGNIERGAGFIGGIGTQGRYDTFDDPVFGIRAISRLADTYATNYGIDTPREFLSRYAPRSDNPDSFDNYLRQLSADLGVSPDEEIDFTNPTVKKVLIPSIIGFEQGADFKNYYSPEVIDAGIRATELQDADEIRSLGEGIAGFEERGIPLLAASSASNLGPQSPTTTSGQLLGGRRTPGQGEDERDLRLEAQTPKMGMFRQRAIEASKVRDPLDQFTPKKEDQIVPELFKKSEDINLEDPVERKRFLETTTREFDPVDRDPDYMARRDDPALLLGTPDPSEAAKTDDSLKPEADPTSDLYQMLRDLAQKRVTSAEEDAEFNKFLALAQMGAALAQSDRGFLGAVGEGIEAGLPTLAASRSGLRDAQEGILETEIDIAKLEADKPEGLTQKQRLDLADKYTGRILEINKQLQKQKEQVGTPDPRLIAELEALKQQLFFLREGIGGISGLNIPTDAEQNLALLGQN